MGSKSQTPLQEKVASMLAAFKAAKKIKATPHKDCHYGTKDRKKARRILDRLGKEV